jgi:hypothetical protein
MSITGVDGVAFGDLGDRLAFVAGDCLTRELPAADVLLMGHHPARLDLDEQQSLFAKAYDALPAGGALIVY